MNILSLIRRFNFWQLSKITVLVVRQPLFIIPTLKATRKTIRICDSLFGNTHHHHGKANAFRHALWNILICQKTFKFSRDTEKSILWAKRVTDLHEKIAPNPLLEETMDLHNNRLGRVYFNVLACASEKEIISFLKDKVNDSKLVKNVQEIRDFYNDLVYLSVKT